MTPAATPAARSSKSPCLTFLVPSFFNVIPLPHAKAEPRFPPCHMPCFNQNKQMWRSQNSQLTLERLSRQLIFSDGG